MGEFERITRELVKVKTEHGILKKALAYFAVDPSEVWFYRSSPPRMAYAHNVPVLGVSASSFYDWFERRRVSSSKPMHSYLFWTQSKWVADFTHI